MDGLSRLLIAIMLLFTFIYVGLEADYSMFQATYGVKSHLNLTEVQGSELTGFYYGSFASGR